MTVIPERHAKDSSNQKTKHFIITENFNPSTSAFEIMMQLYLDVRTMSSMSAVVCRLSAASVPNESLWKSYSSFPELRHFFSLQCIVIENLFLTNKQVCCPTSNTLSKHCNRHRIINRNKKVMRLHALLSCQWERGGGSSVMGEGGLCQGTFVKGDIPQIYILCKESYESSTDTDLYHSDLHLLY